MGARLKFWRRSRVADEAVESISRGFAARDGSSVKSYSTILQRLRRQISLDYYTIPPATQANLFAACGRFARRGTSAAQRQKFHTDDVKFVRNPVINANWTTD